VNPILADNTFSPVWRDPSPTSTGEAALSSSPSGGTNMVESLKPRVLSKLHARGCVFKMQSMVFNNIRYNKFFCGLVPVLAM
jgi:hypothetical protein